jgi:hypothetical protein
MSETDRLGLPLVQAAQAQKHVTVNTGLRRLDGLVQLTLQSTGAPVPPVLAAGAWAVPDGAVNAWEGRSGMIAIAANGGWEFVTPEPGWRAWIVDEGEMAIFDGITWLPGQLTLAASGAGIALKTLEIDHGVSAGNTSVTTTFIPAQTVVFGITGRVLTGIGAGGVSFALGVGPESPDRYGSGYGVGQGAWIRGLTGTPVTYYTDTALTLSATGGAFTAGVVRLAAHGAQLALPRA